MPKDFFRMVHALTFWKIINEDQPRRRPRPSSKNDNSFSEVGCGCCVIIILLILIDLIADLIAKFFV